MIDYKIANILLSEEPQFLGSPHMLCRSTRPFLAQGSGAWCLRGAGKHDFTTFFNGLSIKKWRRYSFAEKFGIHIEIKGASCVICQTRAGAFSYYSEAVEGTSVSVDESAEWQTVDFEIKESADDIIVAFAIDCSGDVEIRNGYYYAIVDEARVRDVELALCTTTFKKEDYITRNIEIIKHQILGSGDSIAGHFHMYVVDNGRTLDADKLVCEGVSIHPNDNAGGAGGFARGMIEAMEGKTGATHVLLMDDDVLVSSESIIRTFNLLSLVNDEYKDAFVSGAMMNMDEPYLRWEEMGYIGADGAFHPIKPVARMDVLHDVVANETHDIPADVMGCVDQKQHYAAWWYCVIPMSQIEMHGLPVPVFVRGDDVEYSRRCKPKFITMNGICIWHLAFSMRYNAAQERYQMTRNCLIDQYASDFAPMSDFIKQTRAIFNLELNKFNYLNAELVLQGIEDFLKGPEWIMQPVAQKAFMDANKNAEKLRPFDEICGELAALGVEVSELNDWDICRDIPITPRNAKLYALTRNGSRWAPGLTEAGKVVVIDNVGWAEPIGKLFGAEYIVAVDIPNRMAAIRHKDCAKFKELEKRYQADMAELRRRNDDLKKAYSEALPKMTSVSFWKEYLGL